MQTALKVLPITSPQNLKLKQWLSLHTAKGIKTHGLCLVSGTKVIAELLTQHPQVCQAIIIAADSQHMQDWLQSQHSQKKLKPTLQTFSVGAAIFQELDLLGTHAPLLVATVPELRPWNSQQQPSTPELLCPLGDPSNLGAVIRSSAAFGIQKIVLLSESAHPFHPRALRSGVGSQFHLEFFKGPSIQDLNTEIIALDLNGTPLSTYTWPKAFRLLIGEEGLGLPAQLQGERLTIEMSSDLESLNANVATSIALYSYFQDQKRQHS